MSHDGQVDTELQLQEDPERPFELWWENYRNTNWKTAALGTLGAKARDAAAELLDEVLRGRSISREDKRTYVRLLTWLIYDAYLADQWDYDED